MQASRQRRSEQQQHVHFRSPTTANSTTRVLLTVLQRRAMPGASSRTPLKLLAEKA